MKKFILFLSALCFTVVTLKAQTKQIVRADYAYPGGRFEMADDTAYTLPAGFSQGGQNKTWDLTNLQSHEQYFSKFSAPSSANGGDTVAGCNMVMQDDENEPSFTYLSVTDTAVFMLTSSEENPMFTGITNMQMIAFPAKFNSTWSNSMNSTMTFTGDEMGLPVDSIRFNLDLQFNSLVDADGVLKLPIGDREVIRVKTAGVITVVTEIYNDVTGWMEVSEDVSESTSYQFMAKAGGNVLASVETDPNDPTSYVSYRSSSLTPNKKVEDAISFRVYPNPSTGGSVNVVGPEKCKVTIIDQTGRIVKYVSNLGGDTNVIDMNELPKGIYFFRIEDENGDAHTEKVIKS